MISRRLFVIGLFLSLNSYGQLIEGVIVGLIIGDTKNDDELYASFLKKDTCIVTNDLNKSYQELTVAIGRNRTDPRLYQKRAYLKRKSGQNGAAMIDFGKAYDLGKEQNFAQTFLDSISLEECITGVNIGKRGVGPCFDSYLLKYSDNKRALFYKALYYYCFAIEKKEQRFAHAIQGFNEVLEIDPENMDARLFIAFSYYRLKDYQQAVKENTRVLNTYPRCGAAYLQRGKTYLELDSAQQACADFEMAASLGVRGAKGFLRDYCK